jgi:hypothetical protein
MIAKAGVKKPAILTMRALSFLLDPFEMDFCAAKPFCIKTVESPTGIKKPADLSAAGEVQSLDGFGGDNCITAICMPEAGFDC